MKPSLRTSRLAALGAGGAVSLALLTGCGDDAASGAGSADRSAAQGQPEPSPAQVVQATNKKTTQAKSARVKLATTVAAGGDSETITGSGVLDLQDGTSRMRLGQGGQQLEQRIVNQVLYQKPPAASGQLPEGKSWMKVDLKRLNRSQGTGGPAMSDPANSFAYTKSLSEKDVRKVGDETVNGVSTTHYRVDLDLSKLAEGDSAQERKLRAQLGDDVPVDLWIDEDGLTRRQQIRMTVKDTAQTGGTGTSARQAQAKVVMDFSGFGTQVDVTAPPAADTVDMTDQVSRQSGTSSQTN
ncbi:MAG: LppX_LprAFG lipoprotein [Streptomyces sp.]|nr:LppX_LprAFG lipoprotein [Streptomyces sp.]